jgi:hypothetical protein
MNKTKQAFMIWEHLLNTHQGICFDEQGGVWDARKCQEVIDAENERDLDRIAKEAKELYYQHNIK